MIHIGHTRHIIHMFGHARHRSESPTAKVEATTETMMATSGCIWRSRNHQKYIVSRSIGFIPPLYLGREWTRGAHHYHFHHHHHHHHHDYHNYHPHHKISTRMRRIPVDEKCRVRCVRLLYPFTRDGGQRHAPPNRP